MSWQSKLLVWYRKNKRDLPWRRTSDPYKIWVSEIMLQQTTVEAVIPYYEKFLKEFPTVQSLAAASEEDVLTLWSGLGYYSRARNLHKAAGIIVGAGSAKQPLLGVSRPGREDRAPTIPDTIAELMQLPGIGRYTAGAIASIAFEVSAPIVDGNVIRFLSRFFRISADPKSPEGRKAFWKKAEDILPKKHLGDFNQALMELGATVCAPENPSCSLCPVSSGCSAKEKEEISDFPKGRKKTVYRDVLMTAAVIRKGDEILLIQRPRRGLLQGMWEIPMVEGGVERLRKKWSVEILQSLPVVRHSVLNRRLKITPMLCRMKGDRVSSARHRWILPQAVSDLPTSSMNLKILERVKDE